VFVLCRAASRCANKCVQVSRGAPFCEKETAAYMIARLALTDRLLFSEMSYDIADKPDAFADASLFELRRLVK
jgi:hypothetical protein